MTLFRTRSRHLSALTAIAGSAALVVALVAGCSSPSAERQPTTTASTTVASTAPSSTTPSSTAPSSTTPSSAPSSKPANGKPAKDEVVAGLAKYYETQPGFDKNKAKKFATCMVDEMYEKASAKTLTAMLNGKPENMDGADTQLLSKSATTCAKVLT